VQRAGKRKRQAGPQRPDAMRVERFLPGQVFPSRMRRTLTFQKTVGLGNVGQVYANIKFIPTYAYDIDPTVGSTSCPFYNELGTIYRFYRVDSSKISVGFSNAETFSNTCCVCPVNSDPGANTTNYQAFFSNPLAKIKIVGPFNGDGITTITHSASTAMFGGVRNVGQNDFYSGPTGGASPPTNNWYWFVGVQSLSGQVNGVACTVRIWIDIEFFELNSPAA